MKKAILAVSFGTSHPEALAQSVFPMEQALARGCPGWEIRRAFTSERVISSLRQQGIPAEDVVQAMSRLEAEGFTHVAVQPLFVTPGSEYEKLQALLNPCRWRLRLSVGAPLLGESSDFSAAAEALASWYPPCQPGEALILMGHGSAGGGTVYLRMAQALQEYRKDICLAVMAGHPSLEDVLAQLALRKEIQTLLLAPFLLTAGLHAHRELALWAGRLREAGYPVSCLRQGLSQCTEIQKRFATHCVQAVSALSRMEPAEPEYSAADAITKGEKS